MKSFIVALLLFSSTCFCQVTLKGKVFESDTTVQGLPGVVVKVKGLSKGTTTDSEGKFTIRLTKEDLMKIDSSKMLLSISFVGFSQLETKYNFKKGFTNISLNENLAMVKLEDDNYAVSTIYFATDRNKTSIALPNEKFGPLRSSLPSFMSYGTCQITIPRDHRSGEIERPSLWKFEFREDPEKHIVILKTDILSKTQFTSSLKTKFTTGGNDAALIFFHGYNVAFDDAARRTAQLSYDLGFNGVSMFYSWPSNGKTLDYSADVGNITWSTPHIQSFLHDFISTTSVKNIYIIAHSMGNQGLTRALADLFITHPEHRSKIKEIILAAPDIDADIFRTQIAPSLVDLKKPITLYASSNDKALMASKAIQQYARLGQSGPGIVILPGMETIDASDLDTGFLSHSYFGDNTSVISDIFNLITKQQRAKDRRKLIPMGADDNRYYKFQK